MTHLLETATPCWDRYSPRIIHTADGLDSVDCFADFTAEIIEGPHRGRVIEAFGWINTVDGGSVIMITERHTGHKLCEIAVLDGNQKPLDARDLDLPHQMLADMCMDVAQRGAFEMFRDAEPYQLDQMLARMDEVAEQVGSSLGNLYA